MTDSSHVSGSRDTKVQHPVQEALTHPVRRVMTAVDRVPGADRVKGIVDGVLDSVGIVSPHARRVAAYTGAGLLGVAGVVEWPVAVTGAAVVWLTQSRPTDGEARAEGLQVKQAARSAKAQTTTRAAKTRPAKKASAASGKAKTRPAKASTASGTAKTRPAKASTASGTAKARSSKRAATSASGTSRAKAGARKKS
ncbi:MULTISPECIES: hypothetical protein [Streptomyces]|uniref:hypothetical protein n=1 Tax=unclassified Streptomyces TaxID=2593676 RepID=UPI00088EC35D|nr:MULTISPECIES: hypothetical protein [unclassified Streptomyces]MDX2730240.1 hypothetical protein [Streptomyces sp. PA03-2a]MDX3768926.1 hypothetical protein [Streptomyces sp. AK08-01B]MDX3815670.1 hypothetical protein [Streptomyces sp. AK08-01A]SCY00891.1 hypothetical protein SAMN02745898_101570 [Streptomyces sp. 136MFCol5.1]